MTTMTCQNCNVSHGPDDMFCENCGYDFITGSLPADVGPSPIAPAATPPAIGTAPPVGAAPSVLSDAEGDDASRSSDAFDVPRLTISIAVDKEFFEAVVTDGEIELPDPIPLDQELELAGTELHIGRTSESRAIHPDVDVAKLTGDQAVSSRHAVLRVANDGSYTVVDVGSTNGTFLADVESEPINHGVPVRVEVGTAIYVGAWTRLSIVG